MRKPYAVGNRRNRDRQALSSAGLANVVVVKSLGPSSKSYPPGKTLPETAKINLLGGDIVTVLGLGRQRLYAARPRQFPTRSR